MREADRELLRRLRNNAPEGVDLEARAASLKELEEAVRIDDGVINALENVVAAQTTELERLGHVVGWIANITVASIICFMIWSVSTGKIPGTIGVFIVGTAAAAVVYGIGRALRYVLAGDR